MEEVVTGLHLSSSKYPFIDELVKYGNALLLTGGKRLRPYVLELAFRDCEGRDRELCRQAGVALELFHHFALIQDDWMDASPTRHGMRATHTWLEEKMDAPYAAAEAVLLGDLYLACAHMLVHQVASKLPPPAQSLFLSAFQAMVTDVLYGQMLDRQTASRTEVTREEILEKTQLKTSRYTFVGPIKMGAALAGQDVGIFAEAYGVPLGIIFQLQDDLADQENALPDEGHTFLTLYGEKGRAEVESSIEHYRGQVLRALPTCPGDPQAWEGLMELVLTRGEA